MDHRDDEPRAARSLRLESLRRQFPALARPTAFLENAGGSQLPSCVIDAMSAYMRDSYVQLSAGYPESVAATEVVERAHDWMETFVNARGVGRVILGASTSALLHMIAECWRRIIQPGDEVIVAQGGHEANISPWLLLEERGARIRWWPVGDDPTGCALSALDALLGPRTRLVCVHHVSNLLGGVVDVAEVVRRARRVGARTVVDGVAYAPHRAIDVASWGCDWYVLSTYKVFGPHMGALFGRHEAIAELTGPGHFFVPRDRVPSKLELGGVCHEGCAGLLGVRPYIALLASMHDQACGAIASGSAAGVAPMTGTTSTTRTTHETGASATGAATVPLVPAHPSDVDERRVIERAFAMIEGLESKLCERLVDGLLAIGGLEMLGHRSHGPERVATVSVRHPSRPSSAIAAAAHARSVAIRNGHMYSHRLCTALGIDPAEGVARVSAVHYNTIEEIDRAVDAIHSAVGA